MVCQEYQKAPISWGGLVYVTLNPAGRLGALGVLLMAEYLQDPPDAALAFTDKVARHIDACGMPQLRCCTSSEAAF
jgi:hypothetical protein